MSKPDPVLANTSINRFSLNLRVQHWLLLLCLLVLALTGFSLYFHTTWLAKVMVKLEGGMRGRGLIHRWAAGFLIVLSLYHFFWLLFTKEGLKEFLTLRPYKNDFKGFFKQWKYFVGLASQSVPADRYNLRQKFQYWGVVAGLGLMIITGVPLWFKQLFMAAMPKWVVDATLILHGQQAVLIFAVLFLWHLYDVHLRPGVFPMDNSWLNGKISLKRQQEEHPLEYERMRKASTPETEGGWEV